MGSRLLRVLLVALALLTACQADVVVDLEVTANGSGRVRVEIELDADAVAALGAGEDLVDAVFLEDLVAAGWTTTEPEAIDDGGVRLSASKGVPAAGQWQQVLDEIAGPGVFTDVAVVAAEKFPERSQSISFELDLRDGWSLLSDPTVTDSLGGEPFGAPIEVLTDGRAIDDVVAVDVIARVAADDGESPTTNSFTPRFDDAEPLAVSLTASTENSVALVLRWIAYALAALAVLAAVLAVIGIVLQRRSDRLRPLPTPASIASRVPGAATAGASAAEPGRSSQLALPASTTNEPVRLVVLESRSVLYDDANGFDHRLMPFVRQNLGRGRTDEIVDAYGELLKGRIDTATFWGVCGIDGDPAAIDKAFVSHRRLRPGAADFLEEMQRRRIPVAATTDDAIEWSEGARERDRLSGVWPWLISAKVRAIKPDLSMFEVLRRESGIAHRHCLFVDTEIESLDAAAELGLKTALFDTGNLDLPEVVGHPVVTDFTKLLG